MFVKILSVGLSLSAAPALADAFPKSYNSLPLRLDVLNEGESIGGKIPPASKPPLPATVTMSVDDCRIEIATGELSVGTQRLDGGQYFVEEPHFIPGSTLSGDAGSWLFLAVETDLSARLVGDRQAQGACRTKLAKLRAARVAQLPRSRDPNIGIPLLALGAFSLEGTRVAAWNGATDGVSFRSAAAGEPASAHLTLDEAGKVVVVDADGLPVSLRSSVFGLKLERAGTYDLSVAPALVTARPKGRAPVAELTGKAP